MGAQSFCLTVDATDARTAFETLFEDAIYDRGHDKYNGTISTCSMGCCKLSFDKFVASNTKKAEKLIRELDNGEKWVAHNIDLGVTGYTQTTAKKVPRTANAQYAWKFKVINCETGKMVDSRAYFDTKEEARKKAIACAEKGLWVAVTNKEKILISGSNVMEEYHPETKALARKPKKMTSSMKAIHRYIFFGWAAS